MPPNHASSNSTNASIALQVAEESETPSRPSMFAPSPADPQYRIRPMQQLISACIGGLITTFVVTPLDVVKTRLQTAYSVPPRRSMRKLCYVFHNGLMSHVCKPNVEECAKVALEDLHMRPNRGALDTIIKIVCNDGFLALWSGLSPTLVSALPSTMIYFVAYDYLKDLYTNLYYQHILKQNVNIDKSNNGAADTKISTQRKVPFMVPMLSGMSARAFICTAVTPIEMVRIKMQSQFMTYNQIRSVVRNLIATQGIRGLWRGLPPTLMRDAPFSGTYWASYELYKRIFEITEPTFLFSFVTGALSGVVATMVTMPFDLITTHTQIELGEKILYTDNANPKKIIRLTTMDRLHMIYRSKGVGGLFVGIIPRLLRVVPACAIMISTFEYSKAFFFRHNANESKSSVREDAGSCGS